MGLLFNRKHFSGINLLFIQNNINNLGLCFHPWTSTENKGVSLGYVYFSNSRIHSPWEMRADTIRMKSDWAVEGCRNTNKGKIQSLWNLFKANLTLKQETSILPIFFACYLGPSPDSERRVLHAPVTNFAPHPRCSDLPSVLQSHPANFIS